MARTKLNNIQENFAPTSFTNTGAGAGTFYSINLGGLKIVFGTTGTQSITGSLGTTTFTLNFPASFFTVAPAVAMSAGNNGQIYIINNGSSTSATSAVLQNGQAGSVSDFVTFIAIGT